MKTLTLMIAAAVLMALPACSWFGGGNETEKTAEQLVKEAAISFRKGDYKDSIESFTTLKDWYPFSKYAILAEMKIGDAHYELQEYDEAIEAYQEFETLHPNNDAIPYIIYRTGLCWYERIKKKDKDQSPARKAIAEFQRLINQFPDDPYAVEAGKKIAACRGQLAAHEAFIGHYYFKAEKYKAALKRFEYVFANYPETKDGQESLKYIAACREEIKKQAESN